MKKNTSVLSNFVQKMSIFLLKSMHIKEYYEKTMKYLTRKA